MKVIKGRRCGFAMLGWALMHTIVFCDNVWAQLNDAPVKVAIIAEDGDLASAGDLMTVELSAQPHVQMLERSQIERVYREQRIATANLDYMKLGQMLGADGLLFLESDRNENSAARTGKASRHAGGFGRQAIGLKTRLVAVKPGVVLVVEGFEIDGDKLSGWAKEYAQRLLPYLPKLRVLAKDAVPISMVNLRSAISSVDSARLTRQLQSLAIERLSREPQWFVLEREKLLNSAEEKKLGGDESVFWNGAWLLDGVLDKDGYSKSIVALDVKMTPAKGGTPVQFNVTGNRTNLAQLINAMAEKVANVLQITPSVKEWNAADEAARFYAEAKWAMNWEVFRQAQAAADAAWALGKHDLDCAIVRQRVRNSQVPLVLPPGNAINKNGQSANFVNINNPPDVRLCDVVCESLECYEEFFRTSPDGEPKVLRSWSESNDWHSSAWYGVGIETLEAASRVLQHFNYFQASQSANAEKLAELRSQTRRVAELIFNSPTVRQSYYTEGRLATSDELFRTIETGPNIFSCMVNWGCFWQERPEDSVALYRMLMQSPVFCYVHYSLWNRSRYQPRLVAWNDDDRSRIPMVWEAFVLELGNTTNLFLQLEAQALTMKKIQNEAALGLAFTNFYDQILANRAGLIANPVSVCGRWDVRSLLQKENDDGKRSAVREQLTSSYVSNYRPHLQQMVQEYMNVTVPAAKIAAVFEQQKAFLRENQRFDYTKFTKLFRERNYSRQQALEVLPLIVDYRSNLVAKAQLVDLAEKLRLESYARSVEFDLQCSVEKIIHSGAQSEPVQPAVAARPQPARPDKGIESQKTISDAVTNIILVKKFLDIPLEGISKDTITAVGMRAHHLFSGKLLLDLDLSRAIHSFGEDGNWRSSRYANIPAIAMLDIASERWQVIEYEETGTMQLNPFYHHTVFWRGSVYTSQGGKLRRFDETRKAWVDLEIPEIGNCGLFVVNERLYGTTRNLIFEILEGGMDMRILASSRRQPPVSALDSEELFMPGYTLGTPALFGDSKGMLRVVTAKRIFSHDDDVWRAVCDLPLSPGIPQITDESILFVHGNWDATANVWRLPAGADRVEYCLGEEQPIDQQNPNEDSSFRLKPLWRLPSGLAMCPLPAVSRGADLLVMMDHSKTQDIVDKQRNLNTSRLILPQDGYHAALFNFSSYYETPQTLYLKFDEIGAAFPVSGRLKPGEFTPNTGPEAWLCRAKDNLYLGREFFGLPFKAVRNGESLRIGVWVVSLEQLDREIGRQKKAQDMLRAQKAVSTGQSAQRQPDRAGQNRD